MGLSYCVVSPCYMCGLISRCVTHPDNRFTMALRFGWESTGWRKRCINVPRLAACNIKENFFLVERRRISQQKSPQHLRLRCLLWPAIWSCTFLPPLHRSALQYHLSVPVKAGQELPCRMQAAHPQCGTSFGISTHMLTLPFPTASTDVVRSRNLYCVFTVTCAPGSVKHTDPSLPNWSGSKQTSCLK